MHQPHDLKVIDNEHYKLSSNLHTCLIIVIHTHPRSEAIENMPGCNKMLLGCYISNEQRKLRIEYDRNQKHQEGIQYRTV